MSPDPSAAVSSGQSAPPPQRVEEAPPPPAPEPAPPSPPPEEPPPREPYLGNNVDVLA